MSYKPQEVAYHITKNTIVVSASGDRGTIKRDDADKWKKAITAIDTDDMDGLKELAIAGFDISRYSHMEIYVHEGKLYRFGTEVPANLASTILKLKDDGLPFNYLLKFWDRLNNNPQESSVEQLYTFLLANNIPITPDGYIMAYKSVRKNKDGYMYDHHSGSIKYSLYKTASMPRDKVVCNPKEACGPGLHVGSYAYASGFGTGDQQVILEILVDPSNVVSVPTDSAQQKCRVCELFVSAVCDCQTQDAVYKPPKKSTKELAKKDVTVGKKSESDNTKIGRYFYAKSPVSTEKVTELTDLKAANPYKKLVKSDFPIFFQRLSVKEMYRQRNGASSNYIAGNNGVFILYDKKG